MKYDLHFVLPDVEDTDVNGVKGLITLQFPTTIFTGALAKPEPLSPFSFMVTVLSTDVDSAITDVATRLEVKEDTVVEVKDMPVKKEVVNG